MTQTIEDKALARIYGTGRGWAFSPKDFADLGSRSSIDLALHRLTNKATIRRVCRGIYDYPRHSELLQQQLGPDMHQVAKAIARRFGWRIQPSGAAAANLIGLSTQIPSQYVYRSDGPNRSYQIGATDLQFKQAALKEFGFKQEESAAIVQALKWLGEPRVTKQVVKQTRDWLPQTKRAAVLKETQGVTDWIYATIKQICRGDL